MVENLEIRGKIDLTETYIDVTSVDAQKGGLRSLRPNMVGMLKRDLNSKLLLPTAAIENESQLRMTDLLDAIDEDGESIDFPLGLPQAKVTL